MPKPPRFSRDEIRQAMRVTASTLIDRTIDFDKVVAPLSAGVIALAKAQNDRDLAQIMAEALFDEMIARFQEARAVVVAALAAPSLDSPAGARDPTQVPAELTDADRAVRGMSALPSGHLAVHCEGVVKVGDRVAWVRGVLDHIMCVIPENQRCDAVVVSVQEGGNAVVNFGIPL